MTPPESDQSKKSFGSILLHIAGLIVTVGGAVSFGQAAIVKISSKPIAGLTFYDSSDHGHTTLEYVLKNKGFGALENVSLEFDVPAHKPSDKDKIFTAIHFDEKSKKPTFTDQVLIETDKGVAITPLFESSVPEKCHCHIAFEVDHTEGQASKLNDGSVIRVRLKASKKDWHPDRVYINLNGTDIEGQDWDEELPDEVKLSPNIHQGILFAIAILVCPIYVFVVVNKHYKKKFKGLNQKLKSQQELLAEQKEEFEKKEKRAFEEGRDQGFTSGVAAQQKAEKNEFANRAKKIEKYAKKQIDTVLKKVEKKLDSS